MPPGLSDPRSKPAGGRASERLAAAAARPAPAGAVDLSPGHFGTHGAKPAPYGVCLACDHTVDPAWYAHEAARARPGQDPACPGCGRQAWELYPV